MSVLAHFDPLTEGKFVPRGAPRLQLSLGAVIEPCQSNVIIQDISSTGVSFESAANLAAGDAFEVLLPQMVSPTLATVVWREQTLFGCEFENPIPRAAISAALLRSVPLMHLQGRTATHTALASASNRTPSGDSSKDAHQIKTVAVAALLCAALTYLLVTVTTFTLLVLGGSLVALCVLLIACCSWALDNTPAT